MKKSVRLISLFAIGCVGLLASCTNHSGITGGGNGSDVVSGLRAFYVTYKGQDVNNGDTFNINVGEKNIRLACHANDNNEDITHLATFTSSDDTVLSISNGLITPLKTGKADVTITNANETDFSCTVHFVVSESSIASGVQSYSTVDYDEKANILGALEKYAVDNYLTGITLFSNGGYVVYNDRYKPLPREYVSGYGWGTMKEGKLDSDLTNVPTKHNPSYYQIGTVSVAGHANAMDASGSDVSDIASYYTTAYYSTRLNASNNGYEWYPSLALDERPIAVDESGNQIQSDYNRRWRIHVRTGDKAPVYRTASTAIMNGVNLSTFNRRAVTLEDYLTPFKIMLTSWNGQYRGSELTDGVSGFTGAASYFNATSTNPNDGTVVDEEAWDNLMGDENGQLPDGSRGNIIVGTDEEGDYIEFNLLYPCTQFYAMYYLSSSLYSPLPIDFVQAVTPSNLGQFPTGYSPVDTFLYTGPYYVEQWQNGQYIKLTRNDDFYEYKEGFTMSDGNHRDVYQIPGFEFQQYSQNALQNEFETGAIDSYAPTKDTLVTPYNTTTGTSTQGVKWTRYQTKGDSNFKLNVNSLTPEEWRRRFGTSGTVYAHDSGETSRWVEQREDRAYLSDKNFLDFLSFALDRETICTSRGMTPTQNYFSDNYLIDPETGISYNSTDAHAAVLADRYNESYGYSPDAAKRALETAMEETIIPMGEDGLLVANGSGQGGTPTNPWLITIDMNWMNPTDEKDYGDVFDSIYRIFDELIDEVYGGCYELDIKQIAGTSDFNAVYDLMKQGEFDLGFGAVSGNDLNPLNFFEVMKGDNSSGFTLNWGPDTSKIDSEDPIIYDGKKWSFDGLWQAADSAALLNNDGTFAVASNVSTKGSGSIKYESIDPKSQSVTYRISFKQLVDAGAKELSLSISNGDATIAYTNEQLEELWDSNYVASIVVDNTLNGTRSVTLRVSFEITINGVDGPLTTETSSTIGLLSYTGVNQ